jgi:hypothetical protein
MDRALAAREYANHLTDADLRLLAPAAPGDPGGGDWLRGDPAALLRLLEDPGTFGTVLGSGGLGGGGLGSGGLGSGGLGQGPGDGPRGWAVQASPFLIFALLVQRAETELATAAHVPERTGLRQRVPLFDAPALRDFLADTARRLFLAELLASFTRVASGRYRVRVAGRARTRRFSELDPVRLAGLLDAVSEAERPGVYRRLGDVSLFLTGVFPDYVTARAFGPVDAGRLLRAAGLTGPQRERLAAGPAIDLLEHLGARWYRTACELAPVRTARLAVAGDVAGRFRQARRVLNHLADRYLLSAGQPWFTPPGS